MQTGLELFALNLFGVLLYTHVANILYIFGSGKVGEFPSVRTSFSNTRTNTAYKVVHFVIHPTSRAAATRDGHKGSFLFNPTDEHDAARQYHTRFSEMVKRVVTHATSKRRRLDPQFPSFRFHSKLKRNAQIFVQIIPNPLNPK